MGVGGVRDSRALLERTIAKAHLRAGVCPCGADPVEILAEVVTRDAHAFLQTPEGDVVCSLVIGYIQVVDAQVVQPVRLWDRGLCFHTILA